RLPPRPNRPRRSLSRQEATAGLPTSAPNGLRTVSSLHTYIEVRLRSSLDPPRPSRFDGKAKVRDGSRPLLPNPMLLKGEGRTHSSRKDNSSWGGGQRLQLHSKGAPVVSIASHKLQGDFWESF